jgi:hypothetical protein
MTYSADSETRDPLTWIQRGSVWALLREDPLRVEQTIVNYIRWSEVAGQYVDFKGRELGQDLELAKTVVEKRT